MDDEDRVGNGHTGRHVDEDSVRYECVIEQDQRVTADLGAAHHFRAAGDVVAAAEPEGTLLNGNAERKGVAVVHGGLSREAADRRRDELAEDLSFLGQWPGRRHDRSEFFELELVDRRVAPDFLTF